MPIAMTTSVINAPPLRRVCWLLTARSRTRGSPREGTRPTGFPRKSARIVGPVPSPGGFFNVLLAVLLSLPVIVSAAELPEGVRQIKVLNYTNCFELSNAETRVTLCHQVGGRVL